MSALYLISLLLSLVVGQSNGNYDGGSVIDPASVNTETKSSWDYSTAGHFSAHVDLTSN